MFCESELLRRIDLVIEQAETPVLPWRQYRCKPLAIDIAPGVD
jgi:hypothetical protein